MSIPGETLPKLGFKGYKASPVHASATDPNKD